MPSRRCAFQLASCSLIVVCLPILAVAGVPTEWVRILDSPGGGYDQILEARCDAAGNVVVTGMSSHYRGPSYDITTIKYDPDGNTLWENRYGQEWPVTYQPMSLCLDASGNVYITGYGGGSSSDLTAHDIVTLKIDQDGALLWAETYDGPGGDRDRGSDICVDADGNVGVVGLIINAAGNGDYVTLKYDPDGALLWDRTYDGPANKGEDPIAIAVDGNGNFAVTGSSADILNSSDYATLLYDPAGTLLWERRYDGPTMEDDNAIEVAFDATGNVYVTGTSDGPAYDYDIATVKYAPDGTVLWIQRFDGGTAANERAMSMQVDATGIVLIAGKGARALGTDPQYVFLKYDSTSSLQRELHVPKATNDATVMTFDASENAYVTGAVLISDQNHDMLTLKIDPAGVIQWEKRYAGPAGLPDYGQALAIDPSGNVYAAGLSYNESINADYLTLKYGTADCTCPYQCDFDENGFIDSVDLSVLAVVAFFGASDPLQPGCPSHRGDFNSDGFTDSIDLSQMIDHVFFGGAGPTDPCGP